MFEKHPHIGSTAFERSGDDFVYYANAWSKGVVVSASARQAYLFGPRTEWFEAISGKDTSVPRRPYWRTVRRILTATFLGYDPAEQSK